MAPLLAPLLLLLFYYQAGAGDSLLPRAELVIGRTIPNVPITLSSGKRTTLREFAGDKPLVVSFIYTRCTSSCPVIVQRLKTSLKGLRDYKVLLIDFDQRDTLEDLRSFMTSRDIVNSEWEVALLGERELRKLTGALDFKFTYDEKTDMFAHPNILVLLTPSLKVSSYILGLSYGKERLSDLLKQARSEDILPNPIKGLLLTCFRYDPLTGTYKVDWSFVAMVVGGALPIALMFYTLVLRELLSKLRGVA